MDRLKTREAERDALRRDLHESAEAEPVVLPIPTELEAIYQAQVERLDHLLTGSNQMITANALLRYLLGEVHVWDDPDARDGVRIEIRSEASRILQGAGQTQRSAQGGAGLSAMQISVVAGVGFGPRSLRL